MALRIVVALFYAHVVKANTGNTGQGRIICKKDTPTAQRPSDQTTQFKGISICLFSA